MVHIPIVVIGFAVMLVEHDVFAPVRKIATHGIIPILEQGLEGGKSSSGTVELTRCSTGQEDLLRRDGGAKQLSESVLLPQGKNGVA